MAMRVAKVKKNPKLAAEKASVQAVRARRKARQKQHSGVKAAALKAKARKMRRRASKIPTVRVPGG